jgi:hypothetical protein
MAWDIVTVSLISACVAFLTAGYILYRWKITKKPQRLLWGLGMLFYALGHLTFATLSILGELGIISSADPLYLYLFFAYIVSSGGVSMALMLAGVLILLTESSMKRWVLPLGFVLFYILGTYLLAFIFPPIYPFNLLTLIGPISNISNCSWFVVLCLIPVSLFIGILYIRHFWCYKELKSSLLIAIHFIGYSIDLFIWPITELKFWFYFIRLILTSILFIAFVILSPKIPKIPEDFMAEMKPLMGPAKENVFGIPEIPLLPEEKSENDKFPKKEKRLSPKKMTESGGK